VRASFLKKIKPLILNDIFLHLINIQYLKLLLLLSISEKY